MSAGRRAVGLGPGWPLGRGAEVGLLCVALTGFPCGTEAQRSDELVLGTGAGGTYYCIITRCNSGTTVVGLVGYAPTPPVVLLAAVRWHECFDCRTFVIAEGTLQLRRSGERVSPFVGAGAGLSSDPSFMGDQLGVHAAVGAWIGLSTRWDLLVELRGRTVGRGDAMGEVSVAIARAVRAR